jgi:hypothetical protein
MRNKLLISALRYWQVSPWRQRNKVAVKAAVPQANRSIPIGPIPIGSISAG